MGVTNSRCYLFTIMIPINVVSLTEKHLHSTRLEAELICAHVFNTTREKLKTTPQQKTSLQKLIKLFWYIYKRKNHTPLAQITGHKNWANLKILINKNVLIPRDETEVLCQKIKTEKRNFNPTSALDIGTGSGCIAIFLNKNIPTLKNTTALDNSKKALKQAKKNKKLHNTKIKFLHSNLLEKIQHNSHFDIIIANLPYVPENLQTQKEIKKEPQTAIFSKDNGLHHIKQLANQLTKKNITYKELWLEFLPFQEKEIKNIFKTKKTTFHKNICGKIFFVKIENNYSLSCHSRDLSAVALAKEEGGNPVIES